LNRTELNSFRTESEFFCQKPNRNQTEIKNLFRTSLVVRLPSLQISGLQQVTVTGAHIAWLLCCNT